MKKIDKFENQMRICKEIDHLVKTKDLDYMDAALLYAHENNLEIEYVGELLSKNTMIRARIEEEAENLNFLKRKARLPI